MKINVTLEHVDSAGAIISLKGVDGNDGVSGTFNLSLHRPITLEVPELVEFHETLSRYEQDMNRMRTRLEQQRSN